MEPSAAGKKGRLLIPDAEVARVMTEVATQEGPTGLLKLAGIKNVVEGWCAAPTLSRCMNTTSVMVLECREASPEMEMQSGAGRP